MRAYRVWRHAENFELLVPTGHYGRAHGHPFRIAFRVDPGAIFDIPLSYDAFKTGPSDYDMPSDEIYCPCGTILRWPTGDAGDLLRAIDQHCTVATAHPMPVRSEAS